MHGKIPTSMLPATFSALTSTLRTFQASVNLASWTTAHPEKMQSGKKHHVSNLFLGSCYLIDV